MAKSRKKKDTKSEAPKRGRGRPSTYSQELVEEICLLISEGLSVRKICEEREGMPERRTIYRWIAKHDEFRRLYQASLEARADLLFDECLTIADDASKDFIMTTSEDGATIKKPDHEHINRARLRVDTRKWMAAKLAPKKYGDRITNEIDGKLEVDTLSQILKEIDGQTRGFPAVKTNSPPPQPNTIWQHSRTEES